MTSKTEIGRIGENFAEQHLIGKNYKILEKNWRFKRAEIDIIAKQELILVFVEVKTKSYSYYGEPEESVTPKKEAFLIDAAQRYMESIDYNWEIRFDIISILLDKAKNVQEIKHFEDAFFQ